MRSFFVPLVLFLAGFATTAVADEHRLQPLAYNQPDLIVDLGVGLWAWPLPMDYNDNGLTDMVVVCTDRPYSGVYLFANTGNADPETGMPVFAAAERLGDAVDNAQVSFVDGEPYVLSPGKVYPDFKETAFEEAIELPVDRPVHDGEGRVRANQWKHVDFNDNGVKDLMVGVGYWGDYGWDDAYDDNGQWTNGPLRGYVYLLRNDGTNDEPDYVEPRQLMTTDGEPIDVFGRPSPNFADFTGDGKPDLLCGEFRDGFTFYRNVGSREAPLFAPGRPLTHNDERLSMDLCMITPVAYDFNGNGHMDLVVGDEDGRVALVEHTGEVIDGVPRFLPPRYFQQEADNVKFGALVTPVGFDWNGNGRDDIIAGNTAGQIAFIENLSGDPIQWAPPKLLEADDEVIHIQAGPNGSIQGPAEAKWGYTTLTVADWNHNGLPDLVVNSIWGKVIWFENVGTREEPRLAAAQPVEVAWEDEPPKPEWNWWDPEGSQLVTQWRTTPVAIDWTGNGLTDLVMLDHEGYLALFRREEQDGDIVLLPGERVFRLEDEDGPLRLNERSAGGSGRRKLHAVDLDGDGRLDLLVNSMNADIYRNLGEEDGMTVFRDEGPVDTRELAGHTSSPTTIDLAGDDEPEILVGAEDGFLYHMPMP